MQYRAENKPEITYHLLVVDRSSCQKLSDQNTKLSCLLCTRGTVVERRSLAGELSLSCARPAADG